MQITVSLRPRELSVRDNANVLVCGAGPSGIMAAISAARCGASVTLIEKQETLGGMATTGIVGPISEFNMNGKRIIGGLPWEFVERMHELGGADISMPSGNVHFDPEIYKLIAHRMLSEAGVKVYLNTHISDCVVKDNRITHVALESFGALFAVSANFFIDCTGNADLCALAKVPFQETPDSAELQAVTLCFQLAGVDTQLLGKTCFQHQNTRYTNFDVRAILEE
jgi:ribulose 1,5-bisphosphate synthetase/thiazole synthase